LRLGNGAAGQVGQWQAEWAIADRCYARAEAISDSLGLPEHADDLLNLGQIRSTTGHVADARALLERARAQSAASGKPDLAWMIELGLGDAAEHAREPEVALTHYRAAAQLA